MIIAVPTNDMLNIENRFEQIKFFKVFTISKNTISNEEFVKNESGSTMDIIKKLSVDFLVMNKTDEKLAEIQNGTKTRIVETQDTIITNAVWKFLCEEILNESNHSCCP